MMSVTRAVAILGFLICASACDPAEPLETSDTSSGASVPTVGPVSGSVIGTSSTDFDAVLRANHLGGEAGVFSRLMSSAFRDTGWNRKSWQDELWQDRGDCNERTLSYSAFLWIPLDANDITISVISASANRILAKVELPDAYFEATLLYSRHQYNWDCYFSYSPQESTVVARAEGLSATVEVKLGVDGTVVEISRVYDLDVEIGDIDVDANSTGFIIDAVLEWVENRANSLTDYVKDGVRAIADEDAIGELLKDALNDAIKKSLEISTSASLNAMTVTARAALSSVESYDDTDDIAAFFDSSLACVSSDPCVGSLRVDTTVLGGSARRTDNDLEVRVPRTVAALAFKAYAESGVLCKTIPVLTTSLTLKPEGTITTAAGTTSDGSTGIVVTMPFAVLQGATKKGTIQLAFEVFVQLDSDGDLVIVNKSSPTIVSTTGSLGYPGHYITLASIAPQLQAAINSIWPSGSTSYDLLPRVLPLDGFDYKLALGSVVHSGGWVTVGLDLEGLTSSGTGGGGGGGGGGGPGIPPFDPNDWTGFDPGDDDDDEFDGGSTTDLAETLAP